MNYYNEFDKFPAEWLRGLMSGGEIPHGDVDERSITDVQATDLMGYRQCHFFAGIGGWARALRLAGISDDANVDTASLPCQPFSTAGLQKGEHDERHLWPVYFGLLQQRRPELAFGEQVSAAIRVGWIDRVQADLEAAGYSFGFVVLGAHSVGAPHIRQRIYWGAKRISDAGGRGHGSPEIAATEGRKEGCQIERGQRPILHRQLQNGPEGLADDCGPTVIGVLHANIDGLRSRRIATKANGYRGSADTAGSGLCDLRGEGSQGYGRLDHQYDSEGWQDSQRHGSEAGHWANATTGRFRDGKTRRIGCGVQPLAHGVPRDLGRTRSILEGMGHGPKEVKRMLRRPRSLLAMAGRNRVGRLKGYGNAIVPQVAAVFIRAFMECQT